MRSVLILCFSILLSCCSVRADLQMATMKVARFHGLLNSGDFDQIIVEADPAMKWPARGPTFKEYLAAIHKKLGFCGTWTRTTYDELMTARGRIAQLHTRMHCDRDDAQETFVFNPADMRIMGYVITSPLLVTS